MFWPPLRRSRSQRRRRLKRPIPPRRAMTSTVDDVIEGAQRPRRRQDAIWPGWRPQIGGWRGLHRGGTSPRGWGGAEQGGICERSTTTVWSDEWPRPPGLPTTMAAAVPRTSDPEAIRRAMFEDGVVVVPDAVDEPLRRAALRAINTEVGWRVPAVPPGQKPQADRPPRQLGSLMPVPSSARAFRRSRRSALPTAFSFRTSWFGRPSSTSTTSRAPARQCRRCWARRTPSRAARLRTAPPYVRFRSGRLAD